jgi:hypothetical protein
MRKENREDLQTLEGEIKADRIKLIMSTLPMEVLFLNDKNQLEEDYSRLDIPRLKAITEAWKDTR